MMTAAKSLLSCTTRREPVGLLYLELCPSEPSWFAVIRTDDTNYTGAMWGFYYSAIINELKNGGTIDS